MSIHAAEGKTGMLAHGNTGSLQLELHLIKLWWSYTLDAHSRKNEEYFCYEL